MLVTSEYDYVSLPFIRSKGMHLQKHRLVIGFKTYLLAVTRSVRLSSMVST